MKLSILTFITSLVIVYDSRSIIAWYSIIGLTTIFSAAVVPIIIMGVVLEIGKLVGSSMGISKLERDKCIIKILSGFCHSSFDVNHKYGYIWIPIKVTY